MEWSQYIDRSQQTLLRLIAVVFSMVGLADGVRPATLPRALRATVFHTLRPAESGLRRLIYTLALEMEREGYVLPEWVKRAFPNVVISSGNGAERVPAFRLIDPRKYFAEVSTSKRPRYTKGCPNIRFFDDDDWDCGAAPRVPSMPLPDDLMDATQICNRLLALRAGLEDIPKQAKRMLRLKARDQRRFIFKAPMRPGLPPGWRENGQGEIDEVLRECHRLAKWALHPPKPG